MSSLTLTNDGDLVYRGGDLVPDEGLGTAILVSLFCDARADDVPAEAQRGWWADEARDRVGSLLWLLEREKATAATAARARDHARRALQWMLDEGIAEAVEVAASYPEPGLLALEVEVRRGTSARWAHLWAPFEGVSREWAGGTLRVRGVA